MHQHPAKVTRVIDGDTIVVDLQAHVLGIHFTVQEVYLRLLDINAPEMRGKERPEGIKAKEFLEGLILNESVVIESHERDSFGRWLSHVFYKEHNVSHLMLEKGYAQPY